MRTNRSFKRGLLSLVAAVVIGTALMSTGCAVYTSGMTLPNPNYLDNRVQYYPPGTEFPFPNEAAQLMDAQIDQ